MIIGMMQPYFLPHLDYFRLIAACDLWIAADHFQFSRRSFQTRNFVWSPDEPDNRARIGPDVRRAGARLPQADVQLQNAPCEGPPEWVSRTSKSLSRYQTRADIRVDPQTFFLDQGPGSFTGLSDLNIALIEAVCSHYEIATKIVRSSGLDRSRWVGESPQQRMASAISALGGTVYLNPNGGVDLYDHETFSKVGVRLSFLQPAPAGPSAPMSAIHSIAVGDELLAPALM